MSKAPFTTLCAFLDERQLLSASLMALFPKPTRVIAYMSGALKYLTQFLRNEYPLFISCTKTVDDGPQE